MLGGRRRRYFGYPKDLKDVIETPSSARSYASMMAPIDSSTGKKLHHCSLKPANVLAKSFADERLHAAISSQIPALLPPLKNTYRFKDYEDNPMKFHPPQLTHHAERSLYYIWLAKNDRHELGDIVDKHLGTRYNKGLHHHLGENFRATYPIQRLAPPDYSRMPRTVSLLDDDLTGGKTVKTRFQKGVKEAKNPRRTNARERFLRDHGHNAAVDAIFGEHPDERTRVTEKDIRECLLAAKRLLGPYAGINTYFTKPDDVPAYILEQIAEDDLAEQQKKRNRTEHKSTKRPFGYISSQVKYEKQIDECMRYYNKLKTGQRHPTPPKNIFTHKEEAKRLKSIRQSTKSPSRVFTRKSLADKSYSNARLTKSRSREHKASGSFVGNPQQRRTTWGGKKSHSHIHIGGPGPRKSRAEMETPITPKKKFNVEHVTEEDYMDMYIHFLGSDEDLSLKKPVNSVTDISKLRKKMHLDPNSDDEDDAAINELLRSDSLSDIRDPIARRIVRGRINPLDGNGMSPEDTEILTNILSEKYESLPPIPTVKETLRRFSAQTLMKSVSKRIETVVPTTPEEEDFTKEELEQFENELGFADLPVHQLVKGAEVEPDEARKSDEGESVSEVSAQGDSSESDVSESHGELHLELDCDPADLECLDDAGALGTPPFESRTRMADAKKQNVEENRRSIDPENLEMSMFAKERWQKAETE